MNHIGSECCSFEVGRIKDADAYCYVCGKVHSHGHLDLRDLRTTFLGRVVRRHNLNWDEIKKDQKKFIGMQKGVLCQSIVTEIEALCPHGKPVNFEGKPLRLHMCYGIRPDDGSEDKELFADASVQEGLDFTSDICNCIDSNGSAHDESIPNLVGAVEDCSKQFPVGALLTYNPKLVCFQPVI